MTWTASIQTFAGAHTEQGSQDGSCAINWVGGFVYIGRGQNPPDHFSQSNILTGAEIAHTTVSGWNDAPNSVLPFYPPGCCDSDGNIVVEFNTGLILVDGTSLAKTTSWGGFAGPFSPGLPQAAVAGSFFGPIATNFKGGSNFTMSGGPGGLFGSTRQMFILENGNFAGFNFGFGTFGGEQIVICAGVAGSGIFYAINGGNLTGAHATEPLVLQRINCLPNAGWVFADWPTTNSQISLTTVASINASAFDGSWTQVQCTGICIDQTDGNILALVDTGSNTRKIVKINAITGAVMWTYANSQLPSGSYVWSQSRILHQQMCLFCPGTTPEVVTVDTSTGVGTTYTATLTGVGNDGNQAFDDTSGVVIAHGAWNGAGGGPTPLNASAAPFTGWFALYVAAPIHPLPPLGSGYFIERMDNREWPAVENVWCVDCALQTTLPTFNATLSVNTATGAGIPTGVTNLFGGQGYSVGTTATINDPTGVGAVVGLTIGSGIITAINISGGTGYTYPVLEFNDPAGTGQGASADVTLDNSAIFIADAAVFNSGMVGDVIRIGGGVATITAYTSTQQLTANITSPIVEVLPNSGGVPIPQPAGKWSIATPTNTIYGLLHLAGFTVTGVADGAVVTPRVVQPDGSVTLDNPATLITLGLPFTPQFQSLYLDGGSPTVQGQRKKVAEVTVRLDASGVTGIQGGSNQPTGSAQSPPVQDIPWTEMDLFETRPDQAVPPYGSTTPPLFTGDVNQPVKGGFDKPGQVAFQQTLPLPMNITAIIPDTLEGDQPEQGFQPKPQREPRGKPKGGGR